jgi:hypothetical protein
MCRWLTSVSLVLLAGTALAADDGWQLRGRVVDEAGRPVAGAAVSQFWSANGTGKRPDGTPLDVAQPAELRELWGHVGQMEPRGPEPAITAADGSFALRVPRRYHAVMAMDASRKRAAIARIARSQENSPVEIQLAPAIRLKATFPIAGSQAAPAWTHVYILLPEDPTRPTDTFRIAHCGSFDARFEVSLPPGRYALDAYGESNVANDLIDLQAAPNREVTLTAEQRELDLGKLALEQRELGDCERRMIEAKRAGDWGDYKQHYGKSPPPWHVTAAEGVSKDVRLEDFRGKWILLYLWGIPCTNCLLDGLPKLTKFYEEHGDQRERFEIVALCTDCDSGLQSIADLDRALAPIVKNVWNGKTLPFPVLLDPTFETMKRYGVLGYGTLLLIDPQGKLVEGDEKTLAKLLKQPSRR